MVRPNSWAVVAIRARQLDAGSARDGWIIHEINDEYYRHQIDKAVDSSLQLIDRQVRSNHSFVDPMFLRLILALDIFSNNLISDHDFSITE